MTHMAKQCHGAQAVRSVWLYYMTRYEEVGTSNNDFRGKSVSGMLYNDEINEILYYLIRFCII
jgi:hypothetical protein